MNYFMDVVFVVDVSKAMAECMDMVKERMVNFLPNLTISLTAVNMTLSDTRVRIISYRNYKTDKENALQISPFYRIKQSNVDKHEEFENFNNYVNSLEAYGGDDNNNALEALAMAIFNDWSQEGDRRMHYIILLTASGACKLEESRIQETYYPSYMPYSLDGLTKLWMSSTSKVQWINGKWEKLKIRQAAKRLLMFAPQLYPWPEIYETWDQVVYNPSIAGEGIDDASLDDIVNTIVSSVW